MNPAVVKLVSLAAPCKLTAFIVPAVDKVVNTPDVTETALV